MLSHLGSDLALYRWAASTKPALPSSRLTTTLPTVTAKNQEDIALMKPVIGLTQGFVGPEEPKCPSHSGSFCSNRSYVDRILQSGGLPIALPQVDARDDVSAILTRLDGLLLTGGHDLDPSSYGQTPHEALGRVQPERSASDLAYARAAVRSGLPVLGVCLGLQVLNVSQGGDLYQDLPSLIPSTVTHRQEITERMNPAHTVTVTAGTILCRLVATEVLEVNSTHHQAAWRIGEGLVVSARAPDGVVEALEHPGLPFCVAVQWHPEELAGRREHRALFESFVQAAGLRAK